MKKTDLTNKSNLKGILLFITQSILFMSLVLLMCTRDAFAQKCEKKSGEKPSTADVLFKVGEKNLLEKLQTMVEEYDVDINQQLTNKETVLTLACYYGYSDMANYLLEHGADINPKNKWNNNAFVNACMSGHTDIAASLLKAGANIDEQCGDGNTGLHFALMHRHNETALYLVEQGANIQIQNKYDRPAIYMASWGGDPKVMKSLIDKGADVNYQCKWGNILHSLANNDNPKSVAIVLKNGGNANTLDEEGRLPLHNAVIRGNPEVVKQLIPATKDINLAEDMMGNTPLHIASINGDINSTQALLDAGAKTNIVNKSGHKPLYYAAKYGNIDVVKAFKDKGLATDQDIAMAEQSRKSSTAKLLNGEARVTYTGHSGWVVQTPENILVFDYWDKNLSSNNCLANGSFCSDQLKDKNIYVFVSHDHGDHFDTTIFSWADKVKNITYVYGFEAEKSKRFKNTAYSGPEYHYIQNDQTQTIKDAKITTHKSNDTGQGFLVEIDGVTIYHPGDHALFTADDKDFFTQEVDFIADQNKNIDIAFLPVSGCPSRWKKEFIVEGFFYSIDKLNPQQVFPMHALDNEYTLKEFAELADERKSKAQIVCTEYRGDSFIVNNSPTAKK